ncbi:MAG: VOC family protein [Actinomycetota bacterium]
MAIALQYCNITVTDVDESLPFYRDGLGLSVVNDVSNGPYRWLSLGVPDQEGLAITLSVPHAGRSEQDGDALEELLAKGSLPFLVFAVDDLDAMYEQVLATGAEVLQEPIDQPWGPRDCAFRDPSGNTVRFNQK